MPRNTASFKLVHFCARIIGSARLISEMFSHTSPSKRVSAIFQMWFGFFCNLLKFDIVHADVPLYKRGHNSETEAKLNKAQHPFSNKVCLNMAADFQLILLEDVRKRTKNVHPYMQFYVIEKKTKNVL